jgi:hypothetical protein
VDPDLRRHRRDTRERFASSLRRLARRVLPRTYSHARQLYLARWANPANVFARHYRAGSWGWGETVSGFGSTLQATESLREELPGLLDELGVRVLVDAGCGDFHWLKEVELPVERYVGLDAVRELIEWNRTRYGAPRREFLQRDVVGEALPASDLVLCRDCLIHLPNAHVVRFLHNVRASGARWLAATTMPLGGPNREIGIGEWRPVDLEAPPFELPPPARRIFDGSRAERERWRAGTLPRPRWIGIWPVDQLPSKDSGG